MTSRLIWHSTSDKSWIKHSSRKVLWEVDKVYLQLLMPSKLPYIDVAAVFKNSIYVLSSGSFRELNFICLQRSQKLIAHCNALSIRREIRCSLYAPDQYQSVFQAFNAVKSYKIDKRTKQTVRRVIAASLETFFSNQLLFTSLGHSGLHEEIYQFELRVFTSRINQLWPYSRIKIVKSFNSLIWVLWKPILDRNLN